jgi:D-beta-D-heptose 7-phosphate kinase/D-beta-D-heptose 1-phosphate adenosyltransferase
MHKILIVGETCVDEYIFGTCNRVCPEAAALCFTRNDDIITKNNLGMAGNVHANMVALCSDAQIDILTNNKDTDKTIIKRRYVDQRYNTIVFREDINDKSDRIIFDDTNFNQYDAIIISDYDKGFLHQDDYKEISSRASDKTIIFADTKKKITDKIYENVDFLKINYSEYINNISKTTKLLDYCELIVTKGSEGACLYSKNIKTEFPIDFVEIRDVCGAGDTFLAGLVSRYINSHDLIESINYANTIAGQVVKKFGVVLP